MGYHPGNRQIETSNMARNIEGRRFREDLFPAELEEVRRRRREAGDDRPLDDDLSHAEPSTDHGLVGLAFSGGGIRSASYSLGVAQCLIEKDLFKHVDILSTVSGGGYSGSCLSALMAHGHDGEKLLTQRQGQEEPPALNHLRNSSNYLVPGGLFNSIRMPSLFLIGVMQTLLLFLPVVVFLVFLTEVFYEVAGLLKLPLPSFTLALMGVLPFVATVFLRPLLQSRRRDWAQRDRADRWAGASLVIAIVSLFSMPVLGGLEFLVENDVTTVFELVSEWFRSHVELGIRSWVFWVIATFVIAVLVVAFVAGIKRLHSNVLLWICGALGPLLLLLVYMGGCICVINSPRVNPAQGKAFRTAFADYVATGDVGGLQHAVDEILVRKQYDPNLYEIDSELLEQGVFEGDDLRIVRRPNVKDTWWQRASLLTRLSTLHQSELTIQPDPLRQRQYWIPELSVLRLHTEWFVYIAAALIWLFNYLVINVNRTSLHPFYRDRLSRTFLISGGNGHDHDDEIESADSLRLSELGDEHSSAPYHIINTALNLQGCRDPQLRQRKTVPFVLSKRFCGSDYTGYCETERIEQIDQNMDLGTAMAISAAAAGPMMGAKTVRSLTFFLAILNVRLAYWLPNPARVNHSSRLDWFIHRNPGLLSLLSEACGVVSNRGRFVNCSDGGHIENLGVYELLRRRCKTIICVDGGADPDFNLFDLTTLQRYAKIDFDAKIDINVSELLEDEHGVSAKHFAVGQITYLDGQQGTLIYLKLSYSGDESEYMRFYKRMVPAFPHEPTSDQFFDETKFEVYRALGHHIAQQAFEDSKVSSRLINP